MIIRDYDPSQGQAFQGDVSIIPIPADIAISTLDEIKPIDNRLILQEGEVSGHHHAVDLHQRHFRAAGAVSGDPLMATQGPKLKKAIGGAKARKADDRVIGAARTYRDAAVAEAMRDRGVLSRTDLAIACLVIEGAPMVLAHEEHDGIRLPPGRYLIGRQVESAGAEERVVAD